MARYDLDTITPAPLHEPNAPALATIAPAPSRSIRELLAEDPDAVADFAKIPDPVAAQTTNADLAAMLADYGEPFSGNGYTFYPRSPKIRGLKAMAKLSANMAQTDDAETNIDGTISMAALFLFVYENGKMRQATAQEVEESELFDLNNLSALISKYSPYKVAAQADSGDGEAGNAEKK